MDSLERGTAVTLKRDRMHTTVQRTILATIILLALCGIASASLNVWSETGGPLPSVAGQRAVYALAISPDGSTIYSGLNSGTVFSLTFGPVPAVLSVSPPTGPVAGGTPVTITGTGFTGAIAVKFGSADATSYTVVSATEITAIAPAGSAGTIDVRVTTPGGISPATSADTFTYTGPATHFAVTIASPQTVGTMFSFTVTALDALDHTATDYPGTVQFSSIDSGATWPSDSGLTDGTGTFSATFMTPGSQTIDATDTMTYTITGTSDLITVNPGPAIRFTVTAPATATAGSSFSITVTAYDQYDNRATGYAGTVHFTSTDPAATLPVDATLTNGLGSFGTTVNTAGTRTITATDTVTSSINGASGNIVVSPGPADRFEIAAPATATAGTSFGYTVTAYDATGNINTTYDGTVHFTSSDPAPTLPADATLTGGTGAFSAMLETAGTQTITATDTVTPSITGASGTITVSPAPATHFTVTAPAAATAGTPVSVTVTALDPYGNRDTGYAGTVHITSSDGAATLPADAGLTAGTGTFSVTLRTTGSRTITGTDTVTSSITGTSGPITVTPLVVPTPTPTPTPTPSPGTTPYSGLYGGGSGGDDSPDTSLPLMTVTVNIGGNSKAWQAVVTGTKLGDLVVTGLLPTGPLAGSIGIPPGTVYQYFTLTPAGYDTITGAVIHFSVPQAWLDENHIAPGSIVLYHKTANGWEALPTTVLYTKDGMVYFSAQTPGFSLFAIAGKPAAATVTVGSTPGILASAVQEQAPVQTAANRLPAVTETTAAPVQVPAGSSGFPFMTAALIGAGCIVLIGSGWYVRRWYIRRQNPALFREYD